MNVVILMLGRDAVMMILVMIVTEHIHLFCQMCIQMVSRSHNDCKHQAVHRTQIIEQTSAEYSDKVCFVCLREVLMMSAFICCTIPVCDFL